jgi:MoxR-like ATPase
MSAAEILEAQELVRQVVVAEDIARYAVRLSAGSRPGPAAPEFVAKWVKWGGGLRASQAMVLGAKARALMDGRYHVAADDIRALAHPVLRHRIVPNFYAESERITSDDIVSRLIETVPAP